MKYIAEIDGKEYSVEILDERHVNLDGQVLEVDFVSIRDQPVYSLLSNGKSFEAFVYPEEDAWQVLLMGRLYSVQVEDERDKQLRLAGGGTAAETGEYHLRSPMPGMVVGIPVNEGQVVEKGHVLLILESMKMQNELKSPRAGIVGRIRVKPGESVEQRQTLLSVQ